jgi:hypothetical protein
VLIKALVPGGRKAAIVSVAADWDGVGMKAGDFALDTWAGGVVIKGSVRPEGLRTVISPFAEIVAHCLDDTQRHALHRLLTFLVLNEGGKAVRTLAGSADTVAIDVLEGVALDRLFLALKTYHRGDRGVVVARMGEYFSGMYELSLALQRAEAEAYGAKPVGGGSVVVIDGQREPDSPRIALEAPGSVARAVVAVSGNDVRVILSSLAVAARLDHPWVLAVIHAENETLGDGDDGTWRVSSSGHRLEWGTRERPATTPSQVDPLDLAGAIARLVGPPPPNH